MTDKSFATPISGLSVYGKLSAVGFLMKHKLSVLVVDPPKNEKALNRLVETSYVN